jgi:hypothetical protein
MNIEAIGAQVPRAIYIDPFALGGENTTEIEPIDRRHTPNMAKDKQTRAEAHKREDNINSKHHASQAAAESTQQVQALHIDEGGAYTMKNACNDLQYEDHAHIMTPTWTPDYKNIKSHWDKGDTATTPLTEETRPDTIRTPTNDNDPCNAATSYGPQGHTVEDVRVTHSEAPSDAQDYAGVMKPPDTEWKTVRRRRKPKTTPLAARGRVGGTQDSRRG